MQVDRRHILRWHACFLMILTPILTPILTVGAYAGLVKGAGPYGGLVDNPMAVAGLAQAYPLMGLVAVAMWMGSQGPAPRRFSLLAIAAHCVPLSALVMLWGPIMASSIAPAIPLSFLIHGGGIAAELVSLLRRYTAPLRR